MVPILAAVSGDTATATIVASLIATLATVGAGYLTNRASTRAAEKNTQTTSRTDIEKEAFSRAEAFYKAALDRQDKELADQSAEMAQMKTDHAVEIKGMKGRITTLESDLSDTRHELHKTQEELRVAKRLLEAKFPNE